MDEISALETQVQIMRAEINTLRAEMVRYRHALDETRRRTGLASIIDEQLESSNSRVHERAL